MLWSTLLGPLPRSAQTQPTAWFNTLIEQTTGAHSSELAILGGRLAATPGLAFLAGYQAALRALVPCVPPGIGALCVTEQRSSKAADIHTRLLAGHISGQKDFVIAGSQAQWLIVLVRSEAAEQAPRLSAVLVATDSPNVSLQARPALPMVPDIPHSSVQFSQASCSVLTGDGWDDYSKPFRTLEDGHVLAAFCAWLYGQSLLDQWPQDLQLHLVALLAGLKETLQQPNKAAATHLLLGGLLAQFASLQTQITQALSNHSSHATLLAWQRDKAILGIANNARMRRLEVALNTLALI
ncbi:MAG: acyl-CoA dehydrogenase [Pseudomonas sp.]|nr:acyl-CoA dehydrogenase [Pseudomonas sp.]